MSPKSINLISEISSLLVKVDPGLGPNNLKLRKGNRVKSIQSSLQIEANSMSEQQVTDIIDGKKVLGPPRDIIEVKNAVEAYEMMSKVDPYSVSDLLKVHGIMMRDLTEQSGMFRTVGVNVVNSSTGEIIHYAPHPDFVPEFVSNLMGWASESEHHPLITSSVFHHEFEYIHPFTDGNGRMGRLWQNIILSEWNPIFEWIPVESAIRDRQSEYYSAIRKATDDDDTSVFIDFMLEAIRDSIVAIIDRAPGDIETKVLAMISEDSFVNAREASILLGVSERTIKRAIQSLKEKDLIEREGAKKNGKWIAIKK